MSRTVAEHLAERARTHPTQVALHIPVSSFFRGGKFPNLPASRLRVESVSREIRQLDRRQVGKLAATIPHRAVTFAKLHADSDILATGLQSVGIVAGTRVALMVPPGLDFFSLTFALFKIGAVPVLIDPGMGIKNLKACLGQAEPEAFIGTAKAHLARRLFGWAKPSVRITVNAGDWNFFCTSSTAAIRLSLPLSASERGPGGEICPNGDEAPSTLSGQTSPPPPPLRNGEGEQDKLAAILFTSGSTGIAKGVEYTHAIFSAQIEMLKTTYGIEPGEIDFCTFPLFALFGAALGMTCVVPIMDATRPATIDPAKVRGQLRQFRCTNLFGSPAVLKRLANELDANPADYASIRRVISAGAPATPIVLEAFTKLLPAGVPIFTPYGATECLPVANISSAEILNETRSLTEQGHGVCVGRPVAGMDVMVIPITDGAIQDLRATGLVPVGTIGEFVVRGPVVTPRYFRNPQATALAKIHDSITGETLHRMGDVGYIDDQGRLWFCGRKSHRVGSMYTDMVESVFNTLQGVVRSALVGIERNGVWHPVMCIEKYGYIHSRVEQPNIKIRLEPWPHMLLRLLSKAKEHPHTASITTFLWYPVRFPVDVRHNSKIFREKLAVWADKKLGSAWKGGPA